MSATREATPRFDARLGKFSQACTFVLVGLAFVLHLPVMVLITTIILALSGINLSVGFCAGCFVYYHLGRLGVTPRVRYQGSFHWRGV